MRKKLTFSRKGKNFEEEVERSLKHLQKHTRLEYERIYDVADYVGRTCPSCHAPIKQCKNCGSYFPTLGCMPPKRKGDFYVIHNGKYYLIECKSTKNNKGFDSNLLKPHQENALINNVLVGMESYVFINETCNSRLYCVKIQDYVTLKLEGKVLKWELLEKHCLSVDRTPFHGKPYFVLQGLFK